MQMYVGSFCIDDNYSSLMEVQDALRSSGLESSNLIIGIDYTKSNLFSGARTFQGKSLHHISTTHVDDHRFASKNPYQVVIEIIGQTLGKQHFTPTTLLELVFTAKIRPTRTDAIFKGAHTYVRSVILCLY